MERRKDTAFLEMVDTQGSSSKMFQSYIREEIND